MENRSETMGICARSFHAFPCPLSFSLLSVRAEEHDTGVHALRCRADVENIVREMKTEHTCLVGGLCFRTAGWPVKRQQCEWPNQKTVGKSDEP